VLYESIRFFLLAVFSLISVLTFRSGTDVRKSFGPSFNIDVIDKTLDPCADFYQCTACGNWIKNTEIPADQSRWGAFNELYERNLATLHEILEKSAVNAPGRNPIDQKNWRLLRDLAWTRRRSIRRVFSPYGPSLIASPPCRIKRLLSGCRRASSPDWPQCAVQFLFRARLSRTRTR